MNLIEQLGGYENAKNIVCNSNGYTHIDIYDGVKYFIYEKQDESKGIGDIITFNSRTNKTSTAFVQGGLNKYGCWHISLKAVIDALLEHRRANNIFEVGDKVLFNGCIFTVIEINIDAEMLVIDDGAYGFSVYFSDVEFSK